MKTFCQQSAFGSVYHTFNSHAGLSEAVWESETETKEELTELHCWLVPNIHLWQRDIHWEYEITAQPVPYCFLPQIYRVL